MTDIPLDACASVVQFLPEHQSLIITILPTAMFT